MPIKMTGSFAGLQRLVKKLENPRPALESASRNMADEGLNLVNEGFSNERDPYGRSWDRLKIRVGKILQKSGGMAASWHREFTADGWRLWAGRTYSKWHQKGTLSKNGKQHVPIRMMVPRPGEVPPRWRPRLMAAGREAIERWMSK